MEYERALVAVDPVIFTIAGSKLKVLLQKREKEPFKGKHELLGGLLRPNETAEETLHRKLKEVLGETTFFTQFHTFTSPKRDPRMRTISIGFIALIREDKVKTHKDWHDVDSLPELAFDHKGIISNAHQYLQQNLNSEIVQHFLPEKFPLNKLQNIHEVILKETFDNRNFRKKMIASGVVEETGETEKEVSHRPAVLYCFKL